MQSQGEMLTCNMVKRSLTDKHFVRSPHIGRRRDLLLHNVDPVEVRAAAVRGVGANSKWLTFQRPVIFEYCRRNKGATHFRIPCRARGEASCGSRPLCLFVGERARFQFVSREIAPYACDPVFGLFTRKQELHTEFACRMPADVQQLGVAQDELGSGVFDLVRKFARSVGRVGKGACLQCVSRETFDEVTHNQSCLGGPNQDWCPDRVDAKDQDRITTFPLTRFSGPVQAHPFRRCSLLTRTAANCKDICLSWENLPRAREVLAIRSDRPYVMDSFVSQSM